MSKLLAGFELGFMRSVVPSLSYPFNLVILLRAAALTENRLVDIVGSFEGKRFIKGKEKSYSSVHLLFLVLPLHSLPSLW